MSAAVHGLSILFSFIALVGCKDGFGRKSGVVSTSPTIHMDFVPQGWSPEQIQISCNAKEDCPPQVGLLFFTFPEVGGRIPFRKCSGFLSAESQVTSNGHCDHLSRAEKAYFITAGPTRQVRLISRVVYKLHTPEAGQDQESGRPDLAVFELSEPILKIRPLGYAKIGDPTYDRLIGFAVNNGETANQFVIDRVECLVRRHESYFPYNISDNPDVLTAFNCSTKRGNSGGPVFAPDLDSVQGVLQGTSEQDRKRRVTRAKLSRDLLSYEQHDTVTITNLRCLGAKAGVCLAATSEQKNLRFMALQNKSIEALTTRVPSTSEGVRFNAIPFQIEDSQSLRFEMFYRPECYEREARPRRITIPLEHLRITLNKWGEPSEEVLGTRLVHLEVQKTRGTALDIVTDWPQSVGELRNAGQHPRRTWGKSFSIDLPPCPR